MLETISARIGMRTVLLYIAAETHMASHAIWRLNLQPTPVNWVASALFTEHSSGNYELNVLTLCVYVGAKCNFPTCPNSVTSDTEMCRVNCKKK